MILPQRDVLDFVDSPWEALPFLRRGWWREQEEGRKWELGLVRKIRKKMFFLIKFKFKEKRLGSQPKKRKEGRKEEREREVQSSS